MDVQRGAVSGVTIHPDSSSRGRPRCRRRPRRLPVAAVLFLSFVSATAACGPDPLAEGGDEVLALPELLPYDVPLGARAAFEVRDSAGVDVVTNGAVGPWGPTRAAVELVLDLRERAGGGTSGQAGVPDAGDYQFGRVSHALPTPDGGVVVADGARIRLFDAEGIFVRELAREGEGPGELQAVEALWWMGDSLAVSDRDQGRVTAFALDGRILAEWSTLGRGTPVYANSTGWLAIVDMPASFQCRGPGADARRNWSARPVQYVRWDAEGARPGELLVELRPRLGEPPDEPGTDVACPLFRRPFPGRDIGRSGRVHVASLDRYRVTVYAPSGEAERIVKRSHHPRPLGEDDVQDMKDSFRRHAYQEQLGDLEELGYPRWFARIAARWSGDAVAEMIDEGVERGMPENAQPLGEVLVSPDGGFWVERPDQLPPGRTEFLRWYLRIGVEAPRRSPSRWDLFDPDGRFLGTVDLPLGFEPTAVDGLEVTGVVEDELGVQSVVRYRVLPPGD